MTILPVHILPSAAEEQTIEVELDDNGIVKLSPFSHWGNEEIGRIKDGRFERSSSILDSANPLIMALRRLYPGKRG